MRVIEAATVSACLEEERHDDAAWGNGGLRRSVPLEWHRRTYVIWDQNILDSVYVCVRVCVRVCWRRGLGELLLFPSLCVSLCGSHHREQIAAAQLVENLLFIVGNILESQVSTLGCSTDEVFLESACERRDVVDNLDNGNGVLNTKSFGDSGQPALIPRKRNLEDASETWKHGNMKKNVSRKSHKGLRHTVRSKHRVFWISNPS